MLPQQSQPNNPSGSSKHTLILTILGLVLTAIGLASLIELRPRPSVSSSSPVDSSNWLTSRFTATNDGYLQLNDVHAICFLWKAQTNDGTTLYSNVIRTVAPENAILQPNQGLTVPCSNRYIPLQGINGPYKSADLAIVVSYRPWPFTFIRQRKLFRFVARPDDGNIVWDKQPPTVLEHDFNTLVNQNPNLSVFK